MFSLGSALRLLPTMSDAPENVDFNKNDVFSNENDELTEMMESTDLDSSDSFLSSGLSTLRTRKVQRSCRSTSILPHDSALVILAPPKGRSHQGDDFANLLKALDSLKNLPDQTNQTNDRRAEVVLFHDEEDDYTEEDIKQTFDAVAPRDMCVVKIQFARFPDGITEQSSSPWSKRSKW